MSQPASDVWRVRTVKLDEFEMFDFEQHDDILYRMPETEQVQINVNWRVDIVGLSDKKVRRTFEFGDDRQSANTFAASLGADLRAMDTGSFSEAYLVIP